MRRITLLFAVYMVTNTLMANDLMSVIKGDKGLCRELRRISKQVKHETAQHEEKRQRVEDELAELDAEHAKEMAELKARAIEAYENAMADYTRKGDIRSATTLMEHVKKLKGEQDHAQPNAATETVSAAPGACILLEEKEEEEKSGVVLGNPNDTFAGVRKLNNWRAYAWKYEGDGKGRWRLAYLSAQGGQPFALTVWADTDGDGRIDKKVAQSPMRGGKPGRWTHFRFYSRYKDIFVGFVWRFSGMVVSGCKGTKPAGWIGPDTLYYSTEMTSFPVETEGNAYASIRLERE